MKPIRPLFLSVSQSSSLSCDSVIGIFDMDTSTVSPDTRAFLRSSQSESKLFSDVTDIPKSFVVSDKGVTLSQLSSQTLASRSKSS
ncbi:MAG: DUF370 domain-containing protein [Clostridia bacterium]|nr:DUF370 domain-containing protein [Clostridia bacterium]